MPIQIPVPTGKADRVLTQPSTDGGMTPAVEVVLQTGVGIKWAGGKQEETLHRGVALTRHPAKGVVDEMIDNRGHVIIRVVLSNLPDRVQVAN